MESSSSSSPSASSFSQKTTHPCSTCPLLQALHKGLWLDDTTTTTSKTKTRRNRTSVRDYWERHEKKIPCAPVMELIESQQQQHQHQQQQQQKGTTNTNSKDGAVVAVRIDREQLHLTSVNLLHNYLSPIKKAFTSPTIITTTTTTTTAAAAAFDSNHNPRLMSPKKPTSMSPTTLEFMDRILVCIRFVQLVLEYQEPVEPEDYSAEASSRSTTSTDIIQTLSMQNDSDIQELVLRWIRSLSGTIGSILEAPAPTDKNDGRSLGFLALDRQCLAAVTLGELLKLQNHYAPTRPFLLAPFGKAVCVMAVALHPPPSAAAAFASSVRVVPRSMLQYGLQTWIQLLQAGLCSTTTATASNSTSNTVFFTPLKTKIFGFLLQRLTVFWNLVSLQDKATQPPCACVARNDDDDHAVGKLDAVRVLVQLHHRIEQHENTNDTHSLVPLRRKLEKCWTATAAGLGPIMVAQELLQLIINSNDNKDEIPLHWVLQYLDEWWCARGDGPDPQDCPVIIDDDDDWESILRLVEHVLFRGLPSAVMCRRTSTAAADPNSIPHSEDFGSTTKILERVLTTLAKTLWCCERHLGAECGRLHQLLVHWLSLSTTTTTATTPAHPLSRETVLELLTRHAVQLEQHHPSTSSSEPLVRLCVRLIFHARTASHLRASLVALVGLEPQWWRGHPGLYHRVRAVVATEYAVLQESLWRRCCERRRRRRTAEETHRKRKYRGNNNNNENGDDCGGLHAAPDLIWILQLLSSTTPMVRAENHDDDQGLLLQELVATGKTKWSPWQVHLAALRTVVPEQHGDSINNNMYESLVSHVVGIWQNRRPSMMSRGQVRLWMILSVALLRRSYRTILHPNSHFSDQNLTETTRLLTICLDEASTGCSNGSRSPNNSHNDLYTPLVLEVIRVLGVLAHAITPQSSAPPLQNMATCFQTLLSPQQPWIVHAHALTALQQVASRLPSVHQNILKQCLPKAMTPWFRARLQGTIFPALPACRMELERQALWQRLNQHHFSTWLVHHRRCRPMLPHRGRHSTAFVAPGSYVLQMPTQAGRHALVVFPPGEQSMEDIRYMLGKEDTTDSDNDNDPDDDVFVSSNSDDGPRLRIVQNGSLLQCGGIQLKLIAHSNNKNKNQRIW